MSSRHRSFVTRVLALGLVVRLGFACVGEDPVFGAGLPEAGTGPDSTTPTTPTTEAGSSSGSDASIEAAPDATYPGDPGSLDDLVEPGSRLLPEWETTAVGVRRFKGWFDRQLKTSCAFLTAEDGVLRCLPSLGPGVVGKAYADGACTEEGVATATACNDGPFAVEVIPGCPSKYKIFKRGAELTDYFSNATGFCSRIIPTPLLAYRLGDVVAPVTFLEATLQPLPNDGGVSDIRAYRIAAEDGASQFGGLRDSKGVDCTIESRESGLRCIPSNSPSLLGTTFHISATCDDTKRIALGPVCPGVSHARELSSQCLYGDSFRAIADASVPEVYFGVPGSCIAGTLAGPYSHVSDTAEPPSIFPLAQAAPLLPNVRLQPRRFVLGDGKRGELDGRYLDQELGADCRFEIAADGKRRCLPDGAIVGDYYEDVACKTSIRLATWKASCLLEAPRFASRQLPADGAACGSSGKRIYKLGPTRPGAVYTKSSPLATDCLPAPTQPYAPLGEELDATMFVPISGPDGGT